MLLQLTLTLIKFKTSKEPQKEEEGGLEQRAKTWHSAQLQHWRCKEEVSELYILLARILISFDHHIYSFASIFYSSSHLITQKLLYPIWCPIHPHSPNITHMQVCIFPIFTPSPNSSPTSKNFPLYQWNSQSLISITSHCLHFRIFPVLLVLTEPWSSSKATTFSLVYSNSKCFPCNTLRKQRDCPSSCCYTLSLFPKNAINYLSIDYLLLPMLTEII